MARRRWETRSFRTSLETYLGTKGWTGITYSEDYGGDAIKVPQINVLIDDIEVTNLELGRTDTSSKLFKRVVQVDVYAESEHRVDAISDDIMDFMDLTAVLINDNNNALLGSLICNDTNTIRTEKIPPVFRNPGNLWWRGAVKARFDAHYLNG